MNITNISSGRKILLLAKEVFHFANFVKCWIPIYQKNNINISMELQYLEKWNARIQTAWVGSDHSNALSFYRSQNVLGWSRPMPDKKMICIQYNCFFCRHKSFWRGTKCSQLFGLAQKNLDRHKTFWDLQKDKAWVRTAVQCT